LIVRLLRVSSTVICLIVVASFGIFALDQTKGASTRQQELLNATAPAPATVANPAASTPAASTPTAQSSTSPGTVHTALDDASRELTSPFAGIVSASSGEWATRSVELVAALLVYGFGLGYLARTLRVSV
jgi:hypothetical protein